MSCPKYFRAAVLTNERIGPYIVREDYLKDYEDNKLVVQPDVPELKIIMTRAEDEDYSDGMSLFSLRVTNSRGNFVIIQHKDGKLQDFDYEKYGSLLVDVFNWEEHEKNKKIIKWPAQPTLN